LLIIKATIQSAKLEKKLRSMKAYVEPSEVTLMEKAATNLRDRLLIRLLFHLGCRVSEALALAVEDIDFNHGTIIIQHLKASLKLSCSRCGQRLGRSHRFCPKCGGKVEKAQAEQQERHRHRVLPVDRDTLGMLREYVRCGGPVLRDGKKLVFGINRHRAWQVVTTCAERADLPKLVNPDTGKIHSVSPHRLRDAFAVHAVKLNDSGDGLRLLQEHLGHASFNTTAKYRKVAGEELKGWYDRLWSKEANPNGAQT
jgi:integrase/recombinase XerD